MPVLPMVVTKPIMPSDFALHFMRVRPVPSCFLPQVRTSSNSPAFNFLVAALLVPASRSKHSVKMVSFTTLKVLPPSSKNLVPALPETLSQPSWPSNRALARIRLRSPSSTGPSSTSTASPISNLRTDFVSLMVKDPVMATSFTTFITFRNIATKVSSETAPDFSSSRIANARAKSSSAMSSPSFSPSAFGVVTMKAANISLSKVLL
mmetsp:Transcript_38970/g.98938  ORF Transcript_38970/g.98938 Transcript_38970/m.98938 type:complete len:207 (-) Transcript_38970:1508-2128(-)